VKGVPAESLAPGSEPAESSSGYSSMPTIVENSEAIASLTWLWELQWATKVLRHLAIKSIFECLGRVFHNTSTLICGARGIRELMLDANKLE